MSNESIQKSIKLRAEQKNKPKSQRIKVCPIPVRSYCVEDYNRSGSSVKGYCVKPHTRKCKGESAPHVVVRPKVHKYHGVYNPEIQPSKKERRMDSIRGRETGISGSGSTFIGDKGVGGMIMSNDMHTGKDHLKTPKELGYSFNTIKKVGNKVIIKPRVHGPTILKRKK